MKSVYIRGNASLYGEVTIQGSKNAALPIMAAALLVPGVCVLENCPRISDVECMCRILESIGCGVVRKGRQIRIDAASLTGSRLPGEYVARMRSSVMLMGPLLGRLGEVSLCHPGGCVIGDRPIDMHIRALSRMGASCRDDGSLLFASSCGLRGTLIRLDYPSVGATENVIMAAVLADGVTCLENCAQEPEIASLCEFLTCCGASIARKGPGRLMIRGQSRLRPCVYTIPADRIVAGTYLCACLVAGGEVFLRGAPAGENDALEKTAERMGAGLERTPAGLLVRRTGSLLSPGEVTTGSFPSFPTDLQSPLLAAMAQAEGESRLKETVFNGRFGVAEELNRMGAGITVEKDLARIPGGRKLTGRRVRARELRGGAALVVAGLCARGDTLVENRGYVDRGYEDICRDLRLLGASVQEG